MFTLWFDELVWVTEKINTNMHDDSYTIKILAKALYNNLSATKCVRWFSL